LNATTGGKILKSIIFNGYKNPPSPSAKTGNPLNMFSIGKEKEKEEKSLITLDYL